MLLRRSLQHLYKAQRAHSSLSVDANEVHRFGSLSAQWSDENGPFKALYSLNKLRVPWIVKNIPKSEKKLAAIDIGCGGGLLSVPLARTGLSVTGIDATPEAVAAAREALQTPAFLRTGRHCELSFHETTAEDFAAKHPAEFDVVIASEIVEHVADVNALVSACAGLAKPGGTLFFTTINKTLLSRVAAVFLAENVLKIVPEGIHDWEKFISPEELTRVLNDNGCRIKFVNGFTYNPIGNEWSWLPSTAMNYALIAQKMN